jgi:hypothetical protein
MGNPEGICRLCRIDLYRFTMGVQGKEVYLDRDLRLGDETHNHEILIKSDLWKQFNLRVSKLTAPSAASR